MIKKEKTIALDKRSRELRKTIVHTLNEAGRGHLGPAFSIVEIVRTLYDDVMRYKPGDPAWPGRDRFILSKGHGCVALYTILADKGFIPHEKLMGLCKFDGMLGGHPESDIPGVEASTGSLGHGLSIGIGMALSARYKKYDYRVFVLLGDGECNEGSVWEAALSASKHKLTNLVAMVDYNKSQAYGFSSEVLDLEPFADKWRSFGFFVTEINGHDMDQLRGAIGKASDDKPTCVICHTVKGKGTSLTENNMVWHHKNKISEEELRQVLEGLGG